MGAADAMGASEEVAVREDEGEKREEEKDNGDVKEPEKENMGLPENLVQESSPTEFTTSKLRNLNPSNPLRVVIQGVRPVRVQPPRSSQVPPPSQAAPPSQAPSSQPPLSTPGRTLPNLNSRNYTNRISLFLFLLHIVAAIGLVGFLVFKGVQGLLENGKTHRAEKRMLKYWLPQAEGATVLSIILAFLWQKSVRSWPQFMVNFIIWSTFGSSLAAGSVLLVFQKPSTDGIGVALLGFAICNGLYACWVTQRTKFCAKVFSKSLEPAAKFPDLSRPTYSMLGICFIWISVWVFAIIGALNFYFPPLIIIALILSLAWVAEVMRNVANLTVSRVIALYYLRGMQSNTHFCFQRALTMNLGSACLGSFFVPAIEALRIVARGLNLLEGEDEFMFSCAHCCLNVMETIFSYGNGWAFVQIAAYGKGFVSASQDTWALFKRQGMEAMVDSDITSAVCFLAGVCSGSICVLVTASWSWAVYRSFTATVSLLAFFIGYLLTRIGMALPHACVACYYVCYAEHPESRLFDKTIPERIDFMESSKASLVPTPRVPVPRRFSV
ncbi:CTL-like protein DDB_G0274487 isoform X2 [Telopea speciosissima]|uniref:CTL-like protein DDB_G0274487 isoform X2 n=1 Tax=Telopea speciosissima TaxID=54955 RepID=UPI001CC3FD29|nr:CTL-like protein DDB_G0274487 isoform X2 [Telopea speciosissima]